MSIDVGRQSTRFMLSRLESQVEELSLVDYPGNHDGPAKWIGVLKGVIDTASSYLSMSELPGITQEASKRHLHDANELAESVYNLTDLLYGAGPNELPHPIVRPLERWYRRAGLKNSTLFRSELVANYEIRPVPRAKIDYIRNKSSSLDAAITAIDWPLQCFTVPAKAFGLLPHFAIVAHEIGHAIYHNISWDFTDSQKLDDLLESAVKKKA